MLTELLGERSELGLRVGQDHSDAGGGIGAGKEAGDGVDNTANREAVDDTVNGESPSEAADGKAADEGQVAGRKGERGGEGAERDGSEDSDGAEGEHVCCLVTSVREAGELCERLKGWKEEVV